MTARRDLLVVLCLTLLTGLLYSGFLLSYVRTSHIKGDDFPVTFDSARQYHPNSVLWVTRGYSSYFAAFPVLPQPHYEFCRPVVNASFWLESLISPGTGPLNLTTNYVGFAITLILFMFFVRRETNGNIRFLGPMLVVFAFSAMWYEATMMPAFRTSLLMTLFALAAFLLLPGEASRHHALLITLSVLCQLASLLSHESGVTTPVIAGLLFVFRGDGKVIRGRLKVLPVFLLPLLCFAALRLAFYTGVSHAYVMEPPHAWLRTGIVNGLQLLPKLFFPWQTDAITSGQFSLRVTAGLLMNLAGYALAIYVLLRPGKAGRAPLLRILSCLGIALTVLCIAPTARFMQLAALFGILATIVAVDEVSQSTERRWVRTGLALGLMGLAAGQLLIFLTSFPRLVANSEAANRLAREEFEGLERAIATSSAPTILVVNDMSGGAGSWAMFEMAAWPNRGRTRRIILVDSLTGEGSPQSAMTTANDNGAVRIEIVVGPNQRFSFGNVADRYVAGRFVNQGLDYQTETVPSYSFSARLLRRFGRKAQPDNLILGHRLVVTVPPQIARDGLLIAGFDPRDMSWFSKELPR